MSARFLHATRALSRWNPYTVTSLRPMKSCPVCWTARQVTPSVKNKRPRLFSNPTVWAAVRTSRARSDRSSARMFGISLCDQSILSVCLSLHPPACSCLSHCLPRPRAVCHFGFFFSSSCCSCCANWEDTVASNSPMRGCVPSGAYLSEVAYWPPCSLLPPLLSVFFFFTLFSRILVSTNSCAKCKF